MSKYITNKGCDKCRKIEVGLTKVKFGKIKHHLCYDCITEFALDTIHYAATNLRTEFEQCGYMINFDNNGGYEIRRKGQNNGNNT